MYKTLCMLVCVALCLPLAASGKDDGTDTSLIIQKAARHFVVQRDGSFTVTDESLIQVNETRGVAAAAQHAYSFNRTLETVEVLEAYNEKPDGRRIAVRPEQITLQQEGQYVGVPMFQDSQVKTVVFPEVAVGDKLYAKARFTRRAGIFPGQFFDTAYPSAYPTRELSQSYDLPADMPLHADADGFTATPASTHDGRTVYRWTYSQDAIARNEIGAVDYVDFGHHLLVSTFDSYAQLGLAYYKGNADAARPGDRVKAQVAVLVKDLRTPRDKALAIANWVRANIRYVATYIGNGGWVPHGAEDVLERHYGDCKDHATLTEAMLGAAGIDSTPVLINAGNVYKLQPVVVASFNHAIIYVPSLDLYLDSTAEDFDAGELPSTEWDKPVILTKTGQIGHTPVRQGVQRRSRLHMRLAADGSASFDDEFEIEGWGTETTRRMQRRLTQAQKATVVESWLNQIWVKGRGSLDTGDLEHPSQVHAYGVHGTADDWADFPGTIGWPAESGIDPNTSVKAAVLGMSLEATRTQPYLCQDGEFDEDAVIELPAGALVLAQPPDLHIDSPYFHYDAQFHLQAHALSMRRHLRAGKADSRVCTPADFQAMQSDIQKMVRDVRSQFILQLPEPQGG